MASKSELLTLHKYYLNANQMKFHFEEVVQEKGTDFMKHPEIWVYLSLWYSCFRVVIEGWKSLKLKDPLIDSLMDADKIVLLNGFRNDTFHFKDDYFSKRTERLLDDKEFTRWIRLLHNPIGDVIVKYLKDAKV